MRLIEIRHQYETSRRESSDLEPNTIGGEAPKEICSLAVLVDGVSSKYFQGRSQKFFQTRHNPHPFPICEPQHPPKPPQNLTP